MNINGRVAGVGGWLGCLIAILFIGGAFSLLTSFNGAAWKEVEKQNPSLLTHTAFQNLQMMDRGIQFVAGFLLIYCGYILYSKAVPETLKTAKIIIGLVYPLSVIFRDLFAPYFFLGLYLSDNEVVGEVTRAVVWAVVWSLYLYRSERVKNTYTNAI
ncbi:DUF2569 family protein [Serratia liquefaciens]|uniref:DUF2569 family protein n=1 Tax=Serratia liquefaciens TaxID=614 RepID=UPI00095EF903|nr:DUF2569 family protein [Serratia liquefaciens]OKP25474.1 hypothetical protein BSQ35_03105 [Serratia liquefaciens]